MGLKDILKRKQPEVWKQDGAVYWLHEASSEPSRYTPRIPGDLNRVASLLRSLNKAVKSDSPVAELEQEEIEEQLIPLLKPE